eukprot:gene3673-4228_t
MLIRTLLFVTLIIGVVLARQLLPGEDPDDTRTFMQVIQAKGYPCEQHFVTTEDGYILQLFRIPYGRAGGPAPASQPAFLQHGLLDSSFTWIVNEPNESLAYILADAGYDVWMGNNRGNTYSTNHTTLSPKEPTFWRFSFDEMGKYDFPAMLNYVSTYTNVAEMPYIGHSEGTIQAWIGYLNNASTSAIAPLFIGLGPIGNVTHCTNTALRDLADMRIDDFYVLFGGDRFMPTPVELKTVFIDFCIACETCCADVIEAICGPHRGAFNDSRMPVVAGHSPAGTSAQNMQHWAQGIRDGQFQAFDYGPLENLEKYKSLKPPVYDVSKIPSNIKIALFSGSLDELADVVDVADLVARLPAEQILLWQKIPDYAHLDYVWATDAHEIIYPEIITLIKKYF